MNDSMKIINATEPKRQSALAVALTAALSLSLSAPLWAATTSPVPAAPKQAGVLPGTKPAHKCMGDVRAFQLQMQKDGYWLHGTGPRLRLSDVGIRV